MSAERSPIAACAARCGIVPLPASASGCTCFCLWQTAVQKLCNMAAAAVHTDLQTLDVAPSTDSEIEPRNFDRVGRYHVLSTEIASGGFCSVYPCKCLNSKGDTVNVAVKLSKQRVDNYDNDPVTVTQLPVLISVDKCWRDSAQAHDLKLASCTCSYSGAPREENGRHTRLWGLEELLKLKQ